MSHLTTDELAAFAVLETLTKTMSEIGDLRGTNANLTLQHTLDQEAIANLTDIKHGLEAAIEDLRARLNGALEREAQLRADLSQVQTDLVSEQRLAYDHWINLDSTKARLNHTECELAAVTIDRDEQKAAKDAAEAKIIAMHKALGINIPQAAPEAAEELPNPFRPVAVETPAPVDSPVVAEHTFTSTELTPEPGWEEPATETKPDYSNWSNWA